jgi:mono/diheme cytochrome c family protein
VASSKRSKRSKARRPAPRPAARPARKNPIVVGVVAVMVIGLVLAIVLPLVVGGSGNDDSSFDPAAAFSQRCAGCHGAAGQGGAGPQLSGGAVVRKYPNIEDQIAVVEDGRGGMPAFKGRGLSDDQIRKIVEYTRSEL